MSLNPNEKKLVEILRIHPLAALLVFDAVTKFADQIAASKLEDFPKAKKGYVSLINWTAYIEVGKLVKKKLDEYHDNIKKGA